MSVIKFSEKYAFAFIILFLIEILIALFVHDTIIRPYIGDILVVILMYVFIRTFTEKIKFLPIYLFIFAALVEVLQYFDIVQILNLQNNKIASVVIGKSFDIKDILCYLCGSIILIVFEKIIN